MNSMLSNSNIFMLSKDNSRESLSSSLTMLTIAEESPMDSHSLSFSSTGSLGLSLSRTKSYKVDLASLAKLSSPQPTRHIYQNDLSQLDGWGYFVDSPIQ